MIAVLFGALVSFFYQGTASYEECKALDFKPEKACQISKKLHDLGDKK